ncbi:MAG: nucleotidyltransferase domain-containing protein [Candidatus Micrarchaeia archaeon]
MTYKSLLLNGNAYAVIKAYRDYLSKKLGRKVSFSEAIEEALGRKYLILNLDPKIAEYLNRFTEMLQRDKGVVGAVLFGSVAKGTFRKDSDIDIMVVVKGPSQPYYDKVHNMIMQLGSIKESMAMEGLFLYISPLIVSEEELKDFDPIFFDIADFGIILFDTDGSIKKFIEHIKALPHRREYTPYGEVLKWKIKEQSYG